MGWCGVIVAQRGGLGEHDRYLGLEGSREERDLVSREARLTLSCLDKGQHVIQGDIALHVVGGSKDVTAPAPCVEKPLGFVPDIVDRSVREGLLGGSAG